MGHGWGNEFPLGGNTKSGVSLLSNAIAQGQKQPSNLDGAYALEWEYGFTMPVMLIS